MGLQSRQSSRFIYLSCLPGSESFLAFTGSLIASSLTFHGDSGEVGLYYLILVQSSQTHTPLKMESKVNSTVNSSCGWLYNKNLQESEDHKERLSS